MKASPDHKPDISTLADVSVIIPCFNEAESIAGVVCAMPVGVLEVLVVDNNSTDDSAKIAAAHGARVIQEKIQGYGSAVRAGLQAAQGRVIAVLDADNQHPPGELVPILAMLNQQNLDFVSASRFPLAVPSEMSLTRRVGNLVLTRLLNILFRLSIRDSQSGMVVFKKDLLTRIRPTSGGMSFVQELKIRAACNPSIGFSEYHIPYRNRIGTSKLHPFRDGTKAVCALIALRAKYFLTS